MAATPDRAPSPPPLPAPPSTSRALAPGGADDPAGRYDANVRLIRRRLADEARMKPKRRWKLI